MDYDSTKAEMQLTATSTKEWTAIYHLYNDESNQNLKNLQDMNNIPDHDPDDPDDSDYDDPNNPDENQGKASMEATLKTYYLWYQVIARYALAQMRFLDEGINLNNVDWNSWATQDLQTLMSLFYSLNDISNLTQQFNSQLDSFLKTNFGDENYDGDTETQEQDKKDWKQVEEVTTNYYLDSLSTIRNQMLAAIRKSHSGFIDTRMIRFSDPLNYVINPDSTTEVKITNPFIIPSFKNLLIDDSLDKGIRVEYGNDGINSLLITIDKSVKSGTWIRFRMYEQTDEQNPPTLPFGIAMLDEIIALYVN